jgi:hypothetical protein
VDRTIGVKNTSYRLVTRHSIDLLAAMIDSFNGNAHLFLEGDLRYFRSEQFQFLRNEPNDLLVRNTIWPLQQFVIIPLENETVHIIKRHVLNCVGIRNRVLHILMEKQGQLVFAAYDCFDPDLVMVTHTDNSFLDALITRKAIWSYRVII